MKELFFYVFFHNRKPFYSKIFSDFDKTYNQVQEYLNVTDINFVKKVIIGISIDRRTSILEYKTEQDFQLLLNHRPKKEKKLSIGLLDDM